MLEPTDAWARRFEQMLADARIAITDDERGRIELAAFGLGRFEVEGLGLIVYENNDRYCAKELMMLPGQTCPEHRHPPVGADPGKRETFRCRAGEVFLYVEGPPTASPACRAPSPHYTVWRQVRLGPGEQFTIPSDTLHWFQAGPAGAIISEFSSVSRDEADVFTDPAIRRLD